jgi:predicted nuclease of predicted toxin-antitoxin system
VKLLADESVFAPMIEELRRAGHSVADADELGLMGAPDTRVFAAAVRGRYAPLTLDKDFTRARRFNPKRTRGILVAKLFKIPVDRASRILVDAIAALDEEAVRGRLVIITKGGVRIRGTTAP